MSFIFPPTSSSSSKPYCTLEWRVIQRNIGSFLVWLLILSTFYVLFLLYSSNPFIITTKKVISQNPNPNLTHTSADTSPLNFNQTRILEPTQTQNPSIPSPSNPKDNNEGRSPVRFSESSNGTLMVAFNAKEKYCDASDGRWVRDSRGSIYTNLTCATLPDLKNCVRHGKDPAYIYWRWKPEGCDMPVFDPWTFLGIVRGKKMAFAGDSLARNQMESLICLLSQAETPAQTLKDERDKFATWYFPSHDFTLMVMWTEFFVEGIERIINGTSSNAFEIHLDRINTNWTTNLPGLNYLIISGGNWFFRKNYLYRSGQPIGCVFCREDNLKHFGPLFAIENVIRKALESISDCKTCDGLVTILRTYTPSHFENGSWFTGGYCNKTQPLEDNELRFEGDTWDIRNIQLKELKRVQEKQQNGNKKMKFEVLDVTKAMMMRADGHPGSFWNRKWMKNSNDCLHWCMPGPVDMWNDLLLSILKKNSFV